ncbi:hypothetical protein [Crocosphaera chwakensis]|uniref:Uncharacterized protein n=1 Tax=Crocosphaera chwakensis CCY0110 TaxID=391612 RepID=A3IWJ6_9CHRO|nr:hypothetical protein [Crocosphaera chwakensis]EAZ89180.1 hypothetical protein CY0110_31800 [Crocosphaera chwakensis CCY0110]
MAVTGRKTQRRSTAKKSQEPLKKEQTTTQDAIDVTAQSEGTEVSKSDKKTTESTDTVASVETLKADQVDSIEEREEQIAKRAELENIVIEHSQSFTIIGKALREIQEKKLHQIEDPNKRWDVYVDETFGIVKSRAYQLIAGTVLYEVLEDNLEGDYSLPKSDTQLRPLYSLVKGWRKATAKNDVEEKERIEQSIVKHYKDSIDVANQEGKELTESIVREVVRSSQQKEVQTSSFSKKDIGAVIEIIKVEGNDSLRGQKGNYGIITGVNNFSVSIETAMGKYDTIPQQCVRKMPTDKVYQQETNEKIKSHISRLKTIHHAIQSSEDKDKRLANYIVGMTASYQGTKKTELNHKLLKTIEDYFEIKDDPQQPQ